MLLKIHEVYIDQDGGVHVIVKLAAPLTYVRFVHDLLALALPSSATGWINKRNWLRAGITYAYRRVYKYLKTMKRLRVTMRKKTKKQTVAKGNSSMAAVVRGTPKRDPRLDACGRGIQEVISNSSPGSCNETLRSVVDSVCLYEHHTPPSLSF